MSSFSELIQQGIAHAWLFIPSAILLGALHGLEPGHSKTMMAAFIVAVRGTVRQAVLLGLAATVSHTAVVWIIALGGMYLWRGVAAESLEPWLQLASGILVVCIALWMLWRTHRQRRATGRAAHGHPSHHHPHRPVMSPAGLSMPATDLQDAHQRAHARDIEQRFAHRQVTTGQIVLFGLTGGLIPCPAAITVLLLCLQLKEISLGFALVLCFSIGLAVTLVAVGATAAVGVRSAGRRWTWVSGQAERAPYLSSALIVLVGLYMAATGLLHL